MQTIAKLKGGYKLASDNKAWFIVERGKVKQMSKNDAHLAFNTELAKKIYGENNGN